jgi:hypothetical protein
MDIEILKAEKTSNLLDSYYLFNIAPVDLKETSKSDFAN